MNSRIGCVFKAIAITVAIVQPVFAIIKARSDPNAPSRLKVLDGKIICRGKLKVGMNEGGPRVQISRSMTSNRSSTQGHTTPVDNGNWNTSELNKQGCKKAQNTYPLTMKFVFFVPQEHMDNGKALVCC